LLGVGIRRGILFGGLTKYGREDSLAYLASLPSAPWEALGGHALTMEDCIIVSHDEAKAKRFLSYKFARDDNQQRVQESVWQLYETKAKRLLQAMYPRVGAQGSAGQQSSSSQDISQFSLYLPFAKARRNTSAPSTPIPKTHPLVRTRSNTTVDDKAGAMELSFRLGKLS
jgi:hypothetical protein